MQLTNMAVSYLQITTSALQMEGKVHAHKYAQTLLDPSLAAAMSGTHSLDTIATVNTDIMTVSELENQLVHLWSICM